LAPSHTNHHLENANIRQKLLCALQITMRLALAGLACALLVAGAAATLGDNGMTTYDGRTRANNTLVFGNQLVIDNAVRAGLEFTQAVLTGTYKPERNDPPTEKKKVRRRYLLTLQKRKLCQLN
jgi:hypothetical protein